MSRLLGWSAITLALNFLLVGCLQAADTPDADEPAPPVDTTPRYGIPATPSPNATVRSLPRAPSFTEAIAMEQAIGAAEPNIALLSDGALFITAPTGGVDRPNAQEGAAYLWRSQDGGSTWDTVRDPQQVGASPASAPPSGVGLFCSCDADVVTSEDGWTYYSDWWIALVAGNYLVEASGDSGDSWSGNSAVIPFEKAQSVDRQWLLAGADGRVGLFYAQFGSPQGDFLGEGRIEAGFSSDHGESWNAPVAVVPVDGDWIGLGHPRMFLDGSYMMPYARVGGGGDFWTDPSEVGVAISTDEGETWEQVKVAEVDEGFDNLWSVQGDVDEAGNAYIAWAARIDDDRMGVWLSTSRDGGRTWGTPVPLRTAGLNFLPWVAATGEGTVAVGWYGGDATGDPAEAPADSEWFAYLSESFDYGRSGTLSKVSASPVKEGGFCPRGASCASDRNLLDYFSMVYAPDGRLHVAFAKESNAPGLGATVHYAETVDTITERLPNGTVQV